MRGLLLFTCDATSEIQLRSTSNGHNHLCFVEGSLRNDNWFLNTRDYLEIVRNDWNSWLWHRYLKLFARKKEVGNSWSLPVHSNSPSNIQSTNLTQKNSMANDQSKQFEPQEEVSNLLGDNTSCTFSPSYVIFCQQSLFIRSKLD